MLSYGFLRVSDDHSSRHGPYRIWNSVTDFLGTCTSTIILALRTAAVWNQDKRITIPLGLLCLGQIIIWTQTMRYSKSVWNDQRHVCQILSTSPVPLLIAVWSYTMILDFLVMLMCSLKLWRTRSHSSIAALLLRDGMVRSHSYILANHLISILLDLLRRCLLSKPSPNHLCWTVS